MSGPSFFLKVSLNVGALFLGSTALPASASPLEPTRVFAIVGDFIGKDDNVAEDLSGIACLKTPDNGVGRCLVIDDQTRTAQFAELANGIIKPDDRDHLLKLFGKSPPSGTVGSEPQEQHCGAGFDKFKDLDGEGVAIGASNTFYVIGSHGCSRKSDLFRSSSFLLLKVEGIDSGATVRGTFHLAHVLSDAPTVGSYFTKTLSGPTQGLNIEGIAITGDELVVGLRAPIIDDTATLVALPESSLFMKDPPAADVGSPGTELEFAL